MRRLEIEKIKEKNALNIWPQKVGYLKTIKNFIVIQIGRYCPSLAFKSWMYRKLLGMKIGHDTCFALMAMVDIFYPEKISIGKRTVLGYNCTLLAHEVLPGEFRTGLIDIGSNVLIGANSTVLPGVKIGDGAVVATGAVVTKDVAPYTMVAGVPAKVVKKLPKRTEGEGYNVVPLA